MGPPDTWRLAHVNPAMMDVFFAGKPLQCDPDACDLLEKEFDWRNRVGKEEAKRYKYVFDVRNSYLHLLNISY